MRPVLTAVVAAALVLSACGSEDAAPEGSRTSAEEATLDAAALTGTWTVDAPGEATSTVVALGGNGVALFRECGRLGGSWRADRHGSFAGKVSHSDARCARGREPHSVPWLESSHEIRAAGAGRVTLHEADGDVVATLTPVPRPTGTAVDAFYELGGGSTEPLIEPDPAPLPDGLRAADRDELLGRWVPVLRRSERPTSGKAWLLLDDYGTATGSDGCNGAGGAWRYRNGTMLVVSGPSTQVGCNNVDVGGWLAGARRAGFDGDVLVLVDAGGRELGRLRHDPSTRGGAGAARIFDPLSISVEVESGTMRRGKTLGSRLVVENRSGRTVVDPECLLATGRYALVPVDDPGAELWAQPMVDCGGHFEMEPGFRESWPGPRFPARTEQGRPLLPGEHLAVLEIEGRSQRIEVPVTVT